MKPSDKNPPARDEAIEAAAAAWFAERDDGLSAEAAAEFERWRLADPRHDQAFRQLETTWTALQQLQSFRPAARIHPDHDLLVRSRARRRPRLPALAAAMALAAAFVIVLAWWRLHSGRVGAAAAGPAASVFATAAHGYLQRTLADGSVLELNADSEARVLYTPGERRVQLVRGEANFTVAKDKARPFWVEAGTVLVRAVGTEFYVSLRPNFVEVLVREGRVQVDRGPTATFAAPAPSLRAVAEVGASQRTFVAAQGSDAPPLVETVSPAVVGETLAWQGGWLEFVDTPLAQVVEEFNRHNRVQIELGDPSLGSKTVGGSFQAENVEAFVRLLASGKDFVVERPDPYHIILRSASRP